MKLLWGIVAVNCWLFAVLWNFFLLQIVSRMLLSMCLPCYVLESRRYMYNALTCMELFAVAG